MQFKVWKSARNGEWYWAMIATNGQKIATGGEGYKRKADLLKTLGRIKEGAAAAPIEETAAAPRKPAAMASQPVTADTASGTVSCGSLS